MTVADDLATAADQVEALAAAMGSAMVLPGTLAAVTLSQSPKLWTGLGNPNARHIRRITQGAGNTIQVEFDHPYPATFLTAPLYCRVEGWDGVSDRAHRANNWTGTGAQAILRDPTHGTPDPVHGLNFGGDPWTATAVDSKTVLLQGSVWKVNSGDPDPFFICGCAYTELPNDLDAAIVDILSWAGDQPLMIRPGPGFYAVLGGTASWKPKAHFVWDGPGRFLNTVFVGDWRNKSLWSFQYPGVVLRGTRWVGNRQFNSHPLDILKITSVTESDSNFDTAIEKNIFESVGGYGQNTGHPGGKARFYIGRNIIRGVNNDATDIKGPQSTNPDGGFDITFFLPRHENWGLGDIGTNRTPSIALVANPVATTSGQSIITVKLSQKVRKGQAVTLAGLADTGGIVAAYLNVPMRALTITKQSGYYATTFDTGHNASSPVTAGGGSGGSFISPAMLDGKPGLDIRNVDPHVIHPQFRVNRPNVNMTRIRGGSGTNNNGEGGHRAIITGGNAENLTPSYADDGSCKGLNIVGKNVTAQGWTFNGRGRALLVNPDADNFDGSGIKAIGADQGGFLNGANMNIQMHAISCALGAYVDGGKTSASFALPDNCMSFSAGTSATVYFDIPAGHGRSTSDVIWPNGFDVVNGVDVNLDIDADPGWTITVDSSTRFHFNSNQTATADATAAGGEDLAYVIDGIAHAATGKIEIDCDSCTTDLQTTTTATVQVHTSRTSNVPAVLSDGSDTTIWGPGNTGGFPNLKGEIVVDASDVTLTNADADKVIILKSSVATVRNATLPSPVRGTGNPVKGWSARVICNNGSGGASPTIGLKLTTPAGTIMVGNNSSSSGGYVVSGTTGATGVMTRRSDSGFNFVPDQGTWTLF